MLYKATVELPINIISYDELVAEYHLHANYLLNHLKKMLLINDINPLNDLLDHEKRFKFGTDSPLKMEVEYQVNSYNISLANNIRSASERGYF